MSNPLSSDPNFSRSYLPHLHRVQHVELIRPAAALAVCHGFVFTPVYAPLVPDNGDSAAAASESGTKASLAMDLAAQVHQDTPYGVTIYAQPNIADLANYGLNLGGDGEEDSLVDASWIIGGHEQPVQAITAIETRRQSGLSYDEATGLAIEDDEPEASTDILLVTSSSDRLIFWSLSHILHCLTASPPLQPTGRVLPVAYDVYSMSLDGTGSKLALCLKTGSVVVIEIESGQVEAVLEGHTGRVNQASFIPTAYLTQHISWPLDTSVVPVNFASCHIMTLGQDRTFKVWDLSSRRLLYTSLIVSSSPFIQVTWDTSCGNAAAARFLLATEDGKVRHYELSKLLPNMIQSVLQFYSATSPTSPASASSTTPMSLAPQQGGSSIRLMHTVDLDPLLRRMLRLYETDQAALRRKKDQQSGVNGKVIRASPSPSANLTANEQLYKPYMATESNVPGFDPSHYLLDEDLALPSIQKDDTQPPTILAMYYPFQINGRPISPSMLESSPSPSPPPGASPSSSPIPKRNPLSSPTRSPTSSASDISSLTLSSTRDTLYICTSRGIVRLNTRTYELEWFGAFLGSSSTAEESSASLPSSSLPSSAVQLHPLPIGFANFAGFMESPDLNSSAAQLSLLLTSPFVGDLSLLTLTIPHSQSNSTQTISVYPTGPLPKSSALRLWSWTPAAPTGPGGKSATLPKRGAKPGQIGAVKDHNLVFHTRIKSSGYGPPSSSSTASKPRQLNLGGLHQKSNSTSGRMYQASQARSKGASSTAAAAVVDRHYPMDCGLINVLSPHNPPAKSPPLHNGPIVSLSFSSDAKRLLTASLDSTACVIRWPSWKHAQGTSHLLGHKKPLRSAAFSWKTLNATKDEMVLTSSSDATVRLWTLGRADPLLVFDRMKKSEVNMDAPATSTSSSTSAAASAASLDNPLFTSDINTCSFFRQNQLILFTHKNQLLMYKYFIDPAKTNTDLKKLQNLNKYKLLSSYSDASSHSLTTFACINSFMSTLILLADSGRNLHIYDASINKVIRTIPDAHSKSIHCITMNPASSFTPTGWGDQSLDMQQLYATSATDSAIKLWDVRAKDCVRRFSGHICRSAPIRVSFSPCGRYLASGSEDNRAYVFDLRNGNIVDKLSGATDVVSDVVYHPLHAQMITSCYDGRIRCYTSA